jgi:hypothetical protein
MARINYIEDMAGNHVHVGDTILYNEYNGCDNGSNFKEYVVDYMYEQPDACNNGMFYKYIVTTSGLQFSGGEFFLYGNHFREFVKYKGLMAEYETWAKTDKKLRKNA